MIPASSSSHWRIVARLCPSALAARISDHRARNWPALVAGFFTRRCARRSLVSVIHCCSALVYSSPFAIAPIVCTAFRHNSTDFDNATGRSTFFDVFQPQRRQQTWVVEHKGLSDELFGVGSYWVHAKSFGCVRQLSKSSAVRPTLCICLRKCFGGRRDRSDAGKLRPKMPPPFSFKVRGQS